ncbi:Arc family DNA-binding protein [Aeromonas rivipollensis]
MTHINSGTGPSFVLTVLYREDSLIVVALSHYSFGGYRVRDWEKFMLRTPPGMREQLKELAKENGRSMNSEIVQRLKEVLKNEGKLA